MTKHKNRNQPKFTKTTARLKDNHTWQAPKGYKIVVLDRGLVSFNIPEKWVLHKLEPVEIYDKAPPDDDCRLSVSFWRLPPGVDWTGLPLDDMLLKATQGAEEDEAAEKGEEGKTDILERGPIVRPTRTDLEIFWLENRFLDKTEKREAFSRHAIARGWDVQVLISFDFWLTDAPKLTPIWDEVVRSLQLGRVIQDPTKGAIHH